MKCKGCPNNVWFGDLALSYCRITREIIEDDYDCHCPEKIKMSRSVIRRTNIQSGKPMNEGLDR